VIDPSNPDFSNTPASSRRPDFLYAPADVGAPPAVTIVTPFFNTGPVFHETAQSVFRQSFQQWEWVIVNDGSTDAGALAILDSYRHRDARIRVVDHPMNRGLSAARNTGFREARTEYVVQLDSDDLIEPTAVEKWFWHLDSNPEVAFCKGYSVGFGAQTYLWEHGFHEGAKFLEENRVDVTSMVRTRVHQTAGGYDESIRAGMEDWDFWLRCASHGFWGHTVPEYHDWYRRRDGQHTRWPNLAAEDQFKAGVRKRYGSIRGRFPPTPDYEPKPNDAIPDHLSCENRLRKSRPRVLLLVPWYVTGGADKFNLDLTRELCSRGWEVSIASTLAGKDHWLARFESLTPDVFALHRFLRLRDYPRFLHYLIQSRGIDAVLISHSELGYRLLPYLRSRCPDVAFMDYLHAVEPTWKDGGYPTMSVRHREHLDLTVTSSEQLRDVVVRRGVEPDRSDVSYTNVDTALLRPDASVRSDVRRELGVDEETPVALFVGRICAQKQPLVLADTFAKLARSTGGFVGLIAGDGPDMNLLHRRITSHGVQSSVRLLGDVSPERVRRLMVAADVLFLPSWYEGLALVLFEGMACGIPVVAADVGGHRELVTPECGVLIAHSDPEKEVSEYSAALADLLSQPARRRAMGMAGRERVVSGFRIEQMGSRMVELLERSIARHQSEPRNTVPPALGQLHAELAIEATRLEGLADFLWSARTPAETQALNHRTHAILSRWFAPIHDFAVRRKWTWVPRAGLVARKLLLGPK